MPVAFGHAKLGKNVIWVSHEETLIESYSDTARPSIDPELLLRIVLIGYLYGITSERKLVEDLRMHLAWRWFTGLGFDQEIQHHSTFSVYLSRKQQRPGQWRRPQTLHRRNR
jgi:transposase